MKSKVREVGDLTAPICNSCGFELDFVQAHLECIKCKQEYDIRKRSGLDVFLWD